MTGVVVLLVLVLELGLSRHAPGWFYIVPLTGIVSGLLYLATTRRCR